MTNGREVVLVYLERALAATPGHIANQFLEPTLHAQILATLFVNRAHRHSHVPVTRLMDVGIDVGALTRASPVKIPKSSWRQWSTITKYASVNREAGRPARRSRLCEVVGSAAHPLTRGILGKAVASS
jgi:hypothetical protein